VDDLSSWKQTFETVSQELEMANRKKQALEDLLAKNRMSRPTYEHLLRGLEEEINRLKTHQKSLAKNMTERVKELQRQISLIEMFLTSLELHRIGQEVDEETYTHQRDILTNGLEASKIELKQIENALDKISK